MGQARPGNGTGTGENGTCGEDLGMRLKTGVAENTFFCILIGHLGNTNCSWARPNPSIITIQQNHEADTLHNSKESTITYLGCLLTPPRWQGGQSGGLCHYMPAPATKTTEHFRGAYPHYLLCTAPVLAVNNGW